MWLVSVECEERRKKNTDVGVENLCILALNMMIIRTLENRMIIRITK